MHEHTTDFYIYMVVIEERISEGVIVLLVSLPSSMKTVHCIGTCHFDAGNRMSLYSLRVPFESLISFQARRLN